MSRQRGMSSLLMVLLLLTLGSLLLEGLNLQQRALLAQTASETQAIRDTAIAHSRACLRIFGDGSLLLSSASGEVQVWQSGEVRGGQVRFSAHGWSDFCPLREASLCQMP
ncbi:MAG: DUF2509 family protein [Klebsiella sp.]|nr:DUF2509 family protein [Klebsiella sp.]